MKTRDKILEASLQLFNEQGERSVTTNHIASHLGISPGNLYYHFKNKQQIIFDIYLNYERLVDKNLQIPEGRPLKIEDKLIYLGTVFQGLWDYRFIHRDLQHLLHSDSELQKRYNVFFKRCLTQGTKIYFGLRDAGIIRATDEEAKALALNTWIIVTSWFGFLHTNLLDEKQQESRELLNAGIHQIFSLERPYLTEEYLEPVSKLVNGLGPSLFEMQALSEP